MEDIRNHDNEPNDEERQWMAESAMTLVARAVALAGVALCVGWATSLVLDQATFTTPMVAEASR